MERKPIMNPLDLPDLGDEYVPLRMRFREGDEKDFWFCNTTHVPETVLPLVIAIQGDTIVWPYSTASQLYYHPITKGIDLRWRMGRGYTTAFEVTPEEAKVRWPKFEEASRYYVTHWEKLVAEAYDECKRNVGDLKKHDLKELPLYPDLAHLLEKALWYNERQWTMQLEFMWIAYGLYLGLFDQTLSEIFPEMGDQEKTRLLQGYDTSLYLRDSEMWRLSNLAIDLGLSDIFGEAPVGELQPRLEKMDAGRSWLEELRNFLSEWGHLITQPWQLHAPTWFEEPGDCLAVIKGYVSKGKHDPKKAQEELANEREQFFQELVTRIKEEQQRQRFEMAVRTFQRVYPFLEDHAYYMEHMTHSYLRYVIVEIARRFVEAGIMDEPNDVFFLTLEELRNSIKDLAIAFTVREYVSWDPRAAINRRKEIVKKQSEWKPVLFVGAPKEIKDPFFIKLWGFTEEYVAEIQAAGMVDKLTGIAASPGVAEGTAKIIRGPREFQNIEAGDILVCAATTPSWSSVFSMIKAVVTNEGGVLSHPANLARAYGIPAVVATARATSVIQTGDRIKVDGTSGEVTIYR